LAEGTTHGQERVKGAVLVMWGVKGGAKSHHRRPIEKKKKLIPAQDSGPNSGDLRHRGKALISGNRPKPRKYSVPKKKKEEPKMGGWGSETR